MDRTNFFNGQRVTSSDLNAIDVSKAEALKQTLVSVLAKFSHTISGSIPADFQQSVADTALNPYSYRGVGGGLSSDYLTPAKLSASQISVQRGWGVTDNMDVIIIPTTITVDKGDDTQNKTWISATSCPMYIVAEYQETSSSVGTTPAGVTTYTRYAGDYKIRVTSVYPSGTSQIPLAQFTADGAGEISGTITDVREYLRAYAADTSVGLSGTATFSGQDTLYDHIHALGTGVPTTVNPHGQVLTDFGYTDSTAAHRKDSHITGIVITSENYATNSYLGTLNTAGPDYIAFAQPAGTALIVDGQYITGAIPLPLYASSAPSDVGDYWVVVNASLVASFLATTIGTLTPFDPHFPQISSQSVLLGRANTVDAANQTISSFTDMRTFYTTAQPSIRADLVEDVSSGSVTLTQYSTLQDNMDRIRFQLGLSLTGTGSVWKTTDAATCINPLTSGSLSTVDKYHRHTIPVIGLPTTSTLVDSQFYQNKSGSLMYITIPYSLETVATPGSAAAAFLYINSTGVMGGNPVDQAINAIAIATLTNGHLKGFVNPNEYWAFLGQTTASGVVTFGAASIRWFPAHTGV